MDAHGNLTSLSEFSNGRRLRLISYMDPDIALGLHAARFTSSDSSFIGEVETLALESFVGVRRLSLGDDGATVLVAQGAAGDTFTLGWAADPGCLLVWGGQFTLSNDRVALAATADDPATHFTVDFVDGCWFALNTPDRDRVADIEGGRTDERTPIIAFSWNGGSNQIWRAEAV